MEKIRSQFILEVLGKPQDFVKESLEKLREEFSKENGVNLVSASIGDPIEIKEDKTFFTGFLDMEFEVERLEILLGMCFKYMPAHLEIIYPEQIDLSNTHINELLNTLSTKLHGYDEVARILQVQNERFIKEIEKLRDVTDKNKVEEKAKDKKK